MAEVHSPRGFDKITASTELPGAFEQDSPAGKDVPSNLANMESTSSTNPSKPTAPAKVHQGETEITEQTTATKPSDMTSPANESTKTTELTKESASSTSNLEEVAKSPRSPPSSEEIELIKDVASFFKSMAPFKAVMPPQLSEDLEELEQRTQAMGQDKPEVDPDDKSQGQFWECTVKRLKMQDWVKNIYYESAYIDGDSPGIPIIKAYFRDTTSLQRVQIVSWRICEELAKITPIEWEVGPMLIASPFKLLVGFMPQVETRLEELSAELEDTKTKRQKFETPELNTAAVVDGQPNSSSDSECVETERKKSIKKAKEREDAIAERLSHLQCYRNFVQDELSDLLEIKEKSANGTLTTVTFSNLWLIFRPGDIIFEDKNGFEQMSQVYFVTGGQQIRSRVTSEAFDMVNEVLTSRHRHRHDCYYSSDEEEEAQEMTLMMGSWTPFSIDTFVMGFDGSKIGPLRERQVIRHFEGEKNILDLDVFPIRFHSEPDALIKRMTQRGKRLLQHKGHMSYQGQAREMGSSPEAVGPTIQGDVFIDPITYYQLHPDFKPRLGRRYLSRSSTLMVEQEEDVRGMKSSRLLHGSEVDTKASEDFFANSTSILRTIPISEIDKCPEYLLLLIRTVIGYAFQAREWYAFDADLLRNIDHSEEARSSGWKDLIIPEDYREILVALVHIHTSHKLETQPGNLQIPDKADRGPQAQIDLIRGKGEGLIILLHGPPGSGKTSTAETIAAYTNRPLYAITCGDLGTTPGEVESRLKGHMERADKWRCVLLLDEADVFLERRTWQNMERNALVSVFLRLLEYYSGILFLTTNRIGVIDEAFKSRIHIVMQYPRIDLQTTLKMWDNIMNRLDRDNQSSDIKIVFDRQALIKYAETHFNQQDSEDKRWNGRQIRNAFQSALALGNYDRVRLRQEAPEADRGKKKFMTVKLSKVNFKKIADTARDFENYIVNLRGEDSSAALGEEVRNDNFDPRLEESRTPVATPTTTRRTVRSPLTRGGSRTYIPESPGASKRLPTKQSNITLSKSKVVGGQQVRQQHEEDTDVEEDLSEEEFAGDDDDDEE